MLERWSPKRPSREKRKSSQRSAYMREWRPKPIDRPRRYLTSYQHYSIKYLHADGVNCAEIARRFGVSYSCVRGIVSGRNKPRKPVGCVIAGTRRGKDALVCR